MVALKIVTIKEIEKATEAMEGAKKADVKLKEKDMNESDSRKFNHLTGYHYMNAIFFRRHKRMIYAPMYRRLTIIGLVFLAAVVIFFWEPSMMKELAGWLPNTLPFCVFVMYQLTSNSQRICKAMYANCDTSLLHYGFYRKSEAILLNFRIRLVEMLKPNLILGGALAAGIVGIAIVAGISWDVSQMLLYVITIILLGIFFSVHYLFLYYFFQPYTAEMTVKSPIFNVINGIIYGLCFACLQLESAPLFFSFIVLLSTAIYILAAIILVYKYSPKRFRIK